MPEIEPSAELIYGGRWAIAGEFARRIQLHLARGDYHGAFKQISDAAMRIELAVSGILVDRRTTFSELCRPGHNNSADSRTASDLGRELEIFAIGDVLRIHADIFQTGACRGIGPGRMLIALQMIAEALPERIEIES